MSPRPKPLRIVSEAVAEADLLSDNRPSLFLAGLTSLRLGEAGALVNGPHGMIDEVGFAGNWSDPLLQRPPRRPEFSKNSYADRFFFVQSGDRGDDLAVIDINEQLVRDHYLRADIDYTGFEVIITLHPEAFGIFADVLDISRQSESTDVPRFLIRISMQVFSFPAQRGNPDPAPAGKQVTQLHPIKQLKVRDMVVARATRRSAQPSDDASILERYQILRASKLSLEG